MCPLIFRKTGAALTLSKTGMVAYLGGVRTFRADTMIILSYVTYMTSNIHVNMQPRLFDLGGFLSCVHLFFLSSRVSKTHLITNHWTNRMANTRLATWDQRTCPGPEVRCREVQRSSPRTQMNWLFEHTSRTCVTVRWVNDSLTHALSHTVPLEDIDGIETEAQLHSAFSSERPNASIIEITCTSIDAHYGREVFRCSPRDVVQGHSAHLPTHSAEFTQEMCLPRCACMLMSLKSIKNWQTRPATD